MLGYISKVILLSVLLHSVAGFANGQKESLMKEMDYLFLKKLILSAKENHPKSKIQELQEKIAKDNVTKAKFTWFDVVPLSFAYSPTGFSTTSNASVTGIQLSVSFNLTSILQKPYAVRQAKDNLAIVKLSGLDNEKTLEKEVLSRYVQYIQQLGLLKLQSKSYLDVEAAFKLVKYKFEKAEETFVNYNQALTGLTSSQQNIMTAEAALILAKANLEDIICKKLEDIR